MVLVACDNECWARDCSSEWLEPNSINKREIQSVCIFGRNTKPRYCPGTELEIVEKRGER